MCLRSLAAMITLLSVASAQSFSGAADLTQAKANDLCNFARFVEWPARSFARPDAPLEICVLGKDSVGSELEHAVLGKSADGRPLELSSNLDIRRVKFCQILFIPRAEQGHIKQVLQSLGNENVLTVSDISNFRGMGGMVNFVEEGNQLGFEVDLGQVQRAGLKMSSRLLAAARMVISPEGK